MNCCITLPLSCQLQATHDRGTCVRHLQANTCALCVPSNRLAQVDGKSLRQLIKVKLGVNLDRTNNNKTLSSTLSKTPGHKMFVNDTGSGAQVDVCGA